MALHLGVMNEGGDMVDRACDCVCGMVANGRCTDRPEGRYMHSDMFGFYFMTWGDCEGNSDDEATTKIYPRR